MANSTRVDEVRLVPETGRYHVFYTDGESPLPNGTGPNSLEFDNLPALQAFISQQQDRLDDQARLAIALSKWTKADPQLANLSLAKGHSCTIDLTGATSSVATT